MSEQASVFGEMLERNHLHFLSLGDCSGIGSVQGVLGHGGASGCGEVELQGFVMIKAVPV